MNSILKLISTESLLIEPLDGQATIAQAQQTFRSHIDSGFRNWGLNKPGQATVETKVAVYEMINDVNLSRMFSSLADNLDKLVMSQSQIISFCQKYPSWLRQDGDATFFLIKEGDKYFVVIVLVDDDGLGVVVNHLEYGHLCFAKDRHRIVAPQL